MPGGLCATMLGMTTSTTFARFIVLAGLVHAVVILTACGPEWFPKCEDPKHPCPNVEPNYPPSPAFGSVNDAGDSG